MDHTLQSNTQLFYISSFPLTIFTPKSQNKSCLTMMVAKYIQVTLMEIMDLNIMLNILTFKTILKTNSG